MHTLMFSKYLTIVFMQGNKAFNVVLFVCLFEGIYTVFLYFLSWEIGDSIQQKHTNLLLHS